MSDSPCNTNIVPDSSFSTSPNFRSHKPFPRRRIAAEPLNQATPWPDHEAESHISGLPVSLASPAAPNATEGGLPPTPPSNSTDDDDDDDDDGAPDAVDFSSTAHADGLVASLTSRKSSLSTPVHQRSPPTPDPSPPRNTTAPMPTPERPAPFTYPSSRAESFTTAREEPLSSEAESRSITPVNPRLSVVEEDRGLGLAFERDNHDTTPKLRETDVIFEQEPQTSAGALESKDAPEVEEIPDREWDTNLMRNVTVRRKRNSKPSPRKQREPPEPESPATGSTPRRASSLRERVQASKLSPHSPSIENFAKEIGWPAEAPESWDTQAKESEQKRLSVSSMSSAVVEATVVVTPPHRRRTLRHSGKNLAYRRDTDTPTDNGSFSQSHRNSMHSEDVPLHRLVHKRASISSRGRRTSSESMAMTDRTATPFLLHQRALSNAAITLRHQESVKSVLQPAADILSRSNSQKHNQPVRHVRVRISSVPETVMRTRTPGSFTTFFDEASPPPSPSPRRQRKPLSGLAREELAPSRTPDAVRGSQRPLMVGEDSPTRRKRTGKASLDTNKSLPETPLDLPIQSTDEIPDDDVIRDDVEEERRPPSAMLERVRHLLAEREAAEAAEASQSQVAPVPQPSSDDPTSGNRRRGSVSSRGRSQERKRSSNSQDRASLSRGGSGAGNASLDPMHNEEPRASHERQSLHSDENARMSFDRSTVKSDEHAMARHLFAQTTPFSQFSDTPIEVSDATAVQFYPHNNNSLFLVEHGRQSIQPDDGSVFKDQRQQNASDNEVVEEPPTPYWDAAEGPLGLPNPTLTVEPSTPPMQLALPTPGAVDSPLKNPRAAPEPPVIKFIPPTPAEELEKQLAPSPPGPPKRSTSHPQRRLSLKQRARRYSDNFISPFLARASSMRGRSASVSHSSYGHRMPTVNDEDGALHPFWRPRGFWDEFDDSDSESDDDVLPRGGDTSDVEDSDPEPTSPRKLGTLGRRLTNGLKTPTFLIGNSLGVERSGTNRRMPHISLPNRRNERSHTREAPKILIQPPTLPFRTRSSRIQTRPSRASLYSGTPERKKRERASGWRQGRNIPGLKGVQVQYIGFSGVKERLRARRDEKRRERRRVALKNSIGGRWYVEPGSVGANVV